MNNADLPRGLCIAICIVLVSLCTLPALSQEQGRLTICKQGEADDWAEPEVWRRDIVVPKGAIFHDVGPIKGPVPPEEWSKLRIETLAAGRIRAREKCITVPAKVSTWDEDWGRLRDAQPVITHVEPKDGRLFEILTFALPLERKLMAPWADVVPVEATIASPMSR